MRALVLSCAFAFTTLSLGSAQAETLTPSETAPAATQQHRAASPRHHHRKAKHPAAKAHTDSTASTGSTGFQPPAASMTKPSEDAATTAPAAKPHKTHARKSKTKRATPPAAKTNI